MLPFYSFLHRSRPVLTILSRVEWNQSKFKHFHCYSVNRKLKTNNKITPNIIFLCVHCHVGKIPLLIILWSIEVHFSFNILRLNETIEMCTRFLCFLYCMVFQGAALLCLTEKINKADFVKTACMV